MPIGGLKVLLIVYSIHLVFKNCLSTLFKNTLLLDSCQGDQCFIQKGRKSCGGKAPWNLPYFLPVPWVVDKHPLIGESYSAYMYTHVAITVTL